MAKGLLEELFSREYDVPEKNYILSLVSLLLVKVVLQFLLIFF